METQLNYDVIRTYGELILVEQSQKDYAITTEFLHPAFLKLFSARKVDGTTRSPGQILISLLQVAHPLASSQ